MSEEQYKILDEKYPNIPEGCKRCSYPIEELGCQDARESGDCSLGLEGSE